MAAKLHSIDKRVSPSPDKYNLDKHMSITQSGQKWVIGKEKRSTLGGKTVSPGPGTYVHRSMCFDIEKPKFYIGNKLNEPKPSVLTPGAGAYEPNDTFSKKNLPSYSMKIKLGSCMTSTKGFVPGPGNYQHTLTDKKNAPKYGFGSSTRETGQKTKL